MSYSEFYTNLFSIARIMNEQYIIIHTYMLILNNTYTAMYNN